MNRWLNMLSAGLAAAVVLPAIAETPVGPGQSQQPAFETPGERGYRPPPFPRQRPRSGVRIERDMTEAGYELRIFTGRESPAAIQVEVQGPSILISRSQSEQSQQSDDRGISRSYSFSRSFNDFRRRISLPRDADAENMQRVDGDGVITITLPRRADFTAPPGSYEGGPDYGLGGYPGYGPGYRPGYAPPDYGPGYDRAYGRGFAPGTPEGYYDESRYGSGPAGYPSGSPYGYGLPPEPGGAPEFVPDSEPDQSAAPGTGAQANPETEATDTQ